MLSESEGNDDNDEPEDDGVSGDDDEDVSARDGDSEEDSEENVPGFIDVEGTFTYDGSTRDGLSLV